MLLAAKGEAALSEALRKLTITTAWSPAVVAAMAKRALVRRA
jgi:hypothetical protein